MNYETTATAVAALTAGTPAAAVRVYLKPTRRNHNGQLYQVRLHDCAT